MDIHRWEIIIYSTLAPWLALAASTLACRQNESTAYVNEQFEISGYLQNLDGGALSTSLVFSTIGSDGFRVIKPVDFTFDSNSGRFSFPVGSAHLLANYSGSLPEQWGQMGANVEIPDVLSGSYGQKSAGHVRFEVLPTSVDALVEAAEIRYAQGVFAVPLSITADPNNEVVISDTTFKVAVGEVGSVPVKIVDSDSKPIEAAAVSVIPLASENVEIGLAQPLLPWKAAAFSPVAVPTDANGLARAFPIPSTGEFQRFQIAAVAPGYCPNTSPQTGYPPRITDLPVTLKLKACTDEEKAADPFGWKAGFSSTTVVGDVNGKSVGFVNSGAINLSLELTGLYMHGFKVTAYEGHEKASTIITTTEFPTFSPTYVINLSNEFKAKSAEGGDFSIEFLPLAQRSDIPKTPKIIHGRFSSAVSSPNASSFKIVSSTGVEGIMSGAAGRKSILRLSSATACDEGDELALVVAPEPSDLDRSTLDFFNCESGDMSIDISSIYTSQELSSDEYELLIVQKNKYGSINSAASDESDKLTVDIDFDRPDLAIGLLGDPLTLGVDFGIVAAAANGPYVFGGAQVKLTRATLSTFKLAFASADTCSVFQEVTTGDFPKVYDFRIGLTASTLNSASYDSATICDGGSIGLGSDLLSIPTSGAGDASFYMQVRDLAGNISSPREYRISPCATSPTDDYCWEN